eukprot:9484865-Pyramimonas_sp.AAC.1
MVCRSPAAPKARLFLPEDRPGLHIVKQHSRDRGGPQFVHTVRLRPMGRWLVTWLGSPFLYSKTVMSSFHLFGVILPLHIRAKILWRAMWNVYGRAFNTSLGTPSGPGAFRPGNRATQSL